MSPEVHALLTGVGGLPGILIAMAACVVVIVAVLSFTRDLWQLPFVYRQRPRTTFWTISPLVAATTMLTITLIGDPKAAVFAVFALVPWLTIKIVAMLAWWRDDRETRSGALALRMIGAARLDDRIPSLGQHFPWPSYLFDVERARRRARYEPPPI